MQKILNTVFLILTIDSLAHYIAERNNTAHTRLTGTGLKKS